MNFLTLAEITRKRRLSLNLLLRLFPFSLCFSVCHHSYSIPHVLHFLLLRPYRISVVVSIIFYHGKVSIAAPLRFGTSPSYFNISAIITSSPRALLFFSQKMSCEPILTQRRREDFYEEMQNEIDTIPIKLEICELNVIGNYNPRFTLSLNISGDIIMHSITAEM